jgi:hypothetical protein
MEFTIRAVIGDYLPLEVKLNIILLEGAFNSIQPGTRHASGLALHFLRIKPVQRDKNVGFREHPSVRSQSRQARRANSSANFDQA